MHLDNPTTDPSPTRVILLGHGSKRAAWRAPFDALSARLGASVAVAYLELCEPTLLQAATQAAAEGIRRLVVLPVFWSGGGHVARDVPGQVALAQQVEGIEAIEVLPAVGEHPYVIEALGRIVADATA